MTFRRDEYGLYVRGNLLDVNEKELETLEKITEEHVSGRLGFSGLKDALVYPENHDDVLVPDVEFLCIPNSVMTWTSLPSNHYESDRVDIIYSPGYFRSVQFVLDIAADIPLFIVEDVVKNCSRVYNVAKKVFNHLKYHVIAESEQAEVYSRLTLVK